jgi:hypothetical protein
MYAYYCAKYDSDQSATRTQPGMIADSMPSTTRKAFLAPQNKAIKLRARSTMLAHFCCKMEYL